MSLHLSAPEVVVQPSTNEIKKALARTARSLVECARSFKRWMDGTCVETPDLPGTPRSHFALALSTHPPAYHHKHNIIDWQILDARHALPCLKLVGGSCIVTNAKQVLPCGRSHGGR